MFFLSDFPVWPAYNGLSGKDNVVLLLYLDHTGQSEWSKTFCYVPQTLDFLACINWKGCLADDGVWLRPTGGSRDDALLEGQEGRRRFTICTTFSSNFDVIFWFKFVYWYYISQCNNN